MRRERGFSLLLTAVSLIGIVGMLGLVIDVGRVYVIKNELQAFVDAAALSAAYNLDGTAPGVTAANTAASSGPTAGSVVNGWNFASETVLSPEVAFSQTFNGVYQPAGTAPASARFVSVRALTTTSLAFLPIVPGIPSTFNVSATAIAGQAVLGSPGPVLAPFSPDAVTPADTVNFGFLLGEQYNLKWAPPGRRNEPGGNCSGDLAANHDAAGGSADRGYINIGQGSGTSDLFDGIVNHDYGPNPVILDPGDIIDVVTGNKNVGPSLAVRIAQDTDSTSTSYSTYSGNGRRILIVPVNDNTVPGVAIGYAAFFLPLTSCIDHNDDACCGEYIGAGLIGGDGNSSGAGGAVYAVKLFQ